MLVLGLCGSLRHDSYNRRLLTAAARTLPRDVDLREWRALDRIPPYNEDLDVTPARAQVRDLRAGLAGADAVLIATPEYNNSVPGSLKTALDWASRPFPHNALQRKPVAVVGASTGLFGAVWAQAEVRRILNASGAYVIEDELPVPSAHEAFHADGALKDELMRASLTAMLDQLLCLAGGSPESPQARGEHRRPHASDRTRRALKRSPAPERGARRAAAASMPGRGGHR